MLLEPAAASRAVVPSAAAAFTAAPAAISCPISGASPFEAARISVVSPVRPWGMSTDALCLRSNATTAWCFFLMAWYSAVVFKSS